MNVLFRYSTGKNLIQPVALEQYFKFEAFNSLAYGAQGLVYWTYAMSLNSETETYLSSLLNRRGERTASWYFAKKTNEEIQKFNYIFLNYKSSLRITLPYISNSNIKYTTYSYKSDFFHIGFSLKSEVGEGMVISFFTNSSSAGMELYILIVSRDPLNYQNICIERKKVL